MIKLQNISKTYHTKDGEINAIKRFDLEIKENEIIALVGPSGCGKSTILSILASLDNDYLGNVIKNDDLIVGYMLQNDALLPYLNNYENAILGLKIKNINNKENLEYVDYLFKLYNLEEFKYTYPSNLSGGMRQRVALIRTLALKPDLLLLDEAFSALDEKSKLLISDDVYKYLKKSNKSLIIVTHSIEEAIYFADKVVILSRRPSYIKRIVNIDIDKNKSIYERKKDKKFNNYFDIIWKDLDINE